MRLAKRVTAIMVLVLVFFSLLGRASAEPNNYVSLTEQEKRYIEERNPVKLGVDPDWYPYEKIDENGDYIGIAADLIELLSNRTGLEFEIVKTEDWNESLEFSKEGKCEALAFLNETEERRSWLDFTKTYFKDPNVIITRDDHDFIADISVVRGKKVVLPRGTSVEERIRKELPDLEILLVDSEDTAIKFVESRKADMTVRSLSMAAYVIKDEGLFNLKIAGQIPELDNQFKMGLSTDENILKQILNKGIATITTEDIERAKNNHISVNIESPINYEAFFIVTGIFLTLLALATTWIRQLKVLNSKLELRQAELALLSKQLSESEALYRSILNASPNAVIISDSEGYITMVSPATLGILGYGEEGSPVGRNLRDFLDKESKRKLTENISKIYKGMKLGTTEYMGLRKDGSKFNIESNSEVIRDESGNSREMVSVVRDVTEKKKIERELKESEEKYKMLSEELQRKNDALREKSTVDQLTGIKNRRYFDQKIGEEKAEADRYGNVFSLILFDLDKFKNVNDTFGHDVGDDVIVETVETVKKLIRSTDMFARWGGEEFTVLMKNTGVEGASKEAERIRKVVEGIEHPVAGKVTVSVGVSEYLPSEKVESLFKRADEALYRAKREGRNRVIAIK